MNTANKIFTCLCCSGIACEAACCIDQWHAIEACGFAYIECGNCCWTICAPICHTCTVGEFGTAMSHCVAGLKYCLYSCALNFCAPIDGLYNCGNYICDVCGAGVTGCGDILKHTDFIGKKIRGAFQFPDTPQPAGKFSEYKPWLFIILEYLMPIMNLSFGDALCCRWIFLCWFLSTELCRKFCVRF